jgi:hypothetical protein
MELMSRIQTGRQAAPRRVMVYGVHGIGKSTFGAMAPNPIFIQTEDGLGNLDCARFPLAEAFDDVMAAIMSLYSEGHDFKTVVIDSLDWLDPFKKVQRGERLRIPAETFNTFIDAAKDFRQRTQNRGQSSLANFADSGIVLVKNASGGDRDRYDILGIERPIFLPSENLLSFTNQLAVIGVTPDEDKHVGRFIVLLEPLKNGLIGRGLISGVTPVRLNVLDPEHEWADIEDGESDSLKTDTAGSAFILWRDGQGSGYGGYGYGYGYYGSLTWALVRIGNLSDGDQWGSV